MHNFLYQERASDSPFVEQVMHATTLDDQTVLRPASSHWYMVFSKWQGQIHPLVVGPWATSGLVSWTKDAEILWIKFRLGVYMPHLPTVRLFNTETMLAVSSTRSFWFKGSAWAFPDYANVDTFVNRLMREEILVRDPVVDSVLAGQAPDISFRTIRHRFLRVTGQSQNRIWQVERVGQAMNLLQQGVSIQDVVFRTGYADQSHLTRSLKHLTGYTPAQAMQLPG